MNTLKKNMQLIVRTVTVLIGITFQVLFFVFVGLYLQKYAMPIFIVIELISLITVLSLVSEQESYRQFWVVIILTLPILGLLLYVAWGRRRTNSRQNRMFRRIESKMRRLAPEDKELLEELKELHPNKVQISKYLSSEGFSSYKNTQTEYFPLGEEMYEELIRDLENARKFIFMEYFIVSEGIIWSRVREVLERKASEGLEVRLLLDDFGCLQILTPQFKKSMQSAGIKLGIFAPIEKNVNSLSFNYRNHQKITVIDGNIGYCGGLNLADEYANLYEKHGHWKDTAVRIMGDGTWGLTTIFIEMWEIARNSEKNSDYKDFMPDLQCESDGFIQPFSDGPANNPKNPAIEVYTHMINKAREYLYITTPYLVLDRRMVEDLCRTARSGVDVHIVVPHIPDKWYVYMVNIANYGILLENGVHIHEYTPGFIHAKMILCDDVCAVCGTINTDYRSFFLHYECGIYLCASSVIMKMKEDIEHIIEISDEITLMRWENRPLWQRPVQWVLRLFGPVM